MKIVSGNIPSNAIPSNAPKPIGNLVQINCFVDADHAGN
jgi:hypothetical protein